MVPFAGWDMPVEYSGLSQEHLAVRTRAGLFDVTHMGQIELAGKDALAAVQWITCNDASRLKIGQAHYSGLTTPAGTFVDDMLVYRFADDHFLLVVNASNVDKDFAWIVEQTRRFDVGGGRHQRALRAHRAAGPAGAAGDAAADATSTWPRIKYYWFAHGEVAGVRGTMSRTGYTGEDGFEMFVPPQQAVRVWDAILEAGRDEEVDSGRASAPATRCASRPRCASTATTSTTRRRCSRPTSSGSSAGTRATSSGAQALAEQKASGRRHAGSSGSRWWTAPSRGTATR